jgi:coenzyme F420-0:L-glutamate ligase/coenzyme F420-1:gamma-L-glutamate ligase
MPTSDIHVRGLAGIGDLGPGDDLAAILAESLNESAIAPATGDILVVAQKAVSKVENRFADLATVTPSDRARILAEETRKDPRLVELILGESTHLVRARPGVLIVRHRNGYVMANAGIDASNLVPGLGEQVLLLPEDADASAARLRDALARLTGVELGVVVSDSFGRPWRNGVTNVAIGAAGIPALLDRRNEKDRYGRTLEVTQVAVGDLLASAAGLAMGEGDEGCPAVHVRGLPANYRGHPDRNIGAAGLIRPLEEDLFR